MHVSFTGNKEPLNDAGHATGHKSPCFQGHKHFSGAQGVGPGRGMLVLAARALFDCLSACHCHREPCVRPSQTGLKRGGGAGNACAG